MVRRGLREPHASRFALLLEDETFAAPFDSPVLAGRDDAVAGQEKAAEPELDRPVRPGRESHGGPHPAIDLAHLKDFRLLSCDVAQTAHGVASAPPPSLRLRRKSSSLNLTYGVRKQDSRCISRPNSPPATRLALAT